MSDRELLEKAAKAAGMWDAENGCIDVPWSPLTDDGDAHRLAVKLRIWIDYQGCGDSTPAHVSAHYYLKGLYGAPNHRWVNEDYVPEEMFSSAYMPDRTHAAYQLEQGLIRGLEPATRRAIVRAAAAIGGKT